MEVQINIQLECTESDARHMIRSTTAVHLGGRAVDELVLSDDNYALLDHAFRKIDMALDNVKAQLRTTAKTR